MTVVIWWLGLTFFLIISRAFTKNSPPVCDHGWVAHNRSCYRLFLNRVNWMEAKKACRDTGGHLVRIESSEENFFLNTTEPFNNKQLWIGLNYLRGSYTWEFLSNHHVNFTSWAPGHPMPKYGFCVKMYGGLWFESDCVLPQNYYICEKEEGKNMCPDGWIPYNNTCFQFNMGSDQKMIWSDAEAACKSTSNFASLVKITSQDEQEFITRRLKDFGIKDVWIGLNDLEFEAVFRWSYDKTVLTSKEFQIWGNGKPSENNDNSDCVMILGVRQDGAWTVQNCSLSRNFICTRHRDMPFCNVPLGMENKNILDSEITASSSLSVSYGPQQARLRHNSYWCPSTTNQKEYLQVDLLSLYNITKIVTEGNVTAYTLKISKDGEGYMDVEQTGSSTSPMLMIPDNAGIVNLKSVIARCVRIYTDRWRHYPCLSVELIGCPAQVLSSTECLGKNWEKGPGNLCYQINMNEMIWSEARSVCLDQGGDLLSIRDKVEHKVITNQLKMKRTSYIGDFWISLNERDYKNYFYWSNNDANSFTSWGSGEPYSYQYDKTNNIACVAMNYKGMWEDANCEKRSPFICMKRDKFILPKDVTQTSPTGVWISSAKYFWPLSAIGNNIVLGTRLGEVNGKVVLTSDVKNKPNSALQFSSEGSYIDFGKFENECIVSPDYCSNGLTLSFMASFDQSAVSWSKRVNIIDSVSDETNYNGVGVYIQNKQLWFVVSKTFKYIKTKIAITGDNTWRHYVMRWNGSDINISVNARAAFTKSVYGSGKDKHASSFVIGTPAASGVTFGKVNLALVAFWDRLISNDDISLIYKTEFGGCPFGWHEYGMSCYQFNTDNKDFKSATIQCQRFGGELLIVNSNVEQAFITDQLRDNSWIGITVEGNHKRKRVLKDSNMDIIKYSNWYSSQPNAWRHGMCTKVLKGGFWEISPCTEQSAYVCEKPKELEVKEGNTSSITRLAYTCQYTRIKLGCPTRLVIRINAAFWGRRKRRRCVFTSVKDCGLTEIGNTTSALKGICDHTQTCDLHASENEPYLTNPCPGVDKYLEVNYSCVNHAGINRCKPGWKFFGDACYRLFDEPKTWNDARSQCQNSGSDLLSITSNLEQSFATSLMERTWYFDVWIGLNDLKTKGVYVWSDGSSISITNWYVGQPDERRTDKSCVYMSLRQSKRGWMYWRDQNCSNEFAFMCKYYIHPLQTPTTPGVYARYCNGYGWSTSDKLAYCYMLNHHGRSWVSAEQNCQYFGGYLASVLSKEENEFIRKLTTQNIWIGMESKGVFRGHSWTDGKPVVYTNWDVNQPDSYNGVESCVEMDSRTGRWSDAKCDLGKRSVCKKPKTIQHVKAPTTAYPTPGSPLCKKDWTLFQERCYITGEYKTSIDIRTWHEAEKYCQTFNNGHLASINSKDEQDFIEFLIKDIHTSYYRYWIGLTDIHIESSYRWSDGSVFKYANWNRYEPNDDERQEDCISVGKDGMWKDKPCQFKYSYICKAYPESYTPLPTPKPTRPPTDGYCAQGWIANGLYCYKFYTRRSEFKTWYDARDFCHQGGTSGDRGELVSILDVFEQAFLIAHLKGVKQPLWIGFNNAHPDRRLTYVWVDNRPTSYVNWNVGQPPAYSSYRCVEMIQTRWAAGRWNAVNCRILNGYICKTAASNKSLKTGPTPPEPNKCPKGYKSLDDSCYKFFNSHKTFDEARKTCQKENADLMAVDTHYTQAYLVYLLERYIGNVWIGFVHEPYSSFKFVDHRATEYTYWGAGQPNREVSERSCTQANITGSDLGVWDDVDCDTTNPFVCEIYQGEPHVTIPLDAHCPEGWKQHHKYCYQYIDNGRKWTAAQFHCARMGANLVSIHNKKDEDFLMYYFRDMNLDFVWTGLNDLQIQHVYTWSDKSPLNYINWSKTQPRNYYGHENCVKMHTKTGRWETTSCDSYLHYMCKRRLECASVIHLDPSMMTVTDTVNATSFGANKAILNDEKSYETAWCTNNTSGTAKIMVELGQLARVTAISFRGRYYWNRVLDEQETSYVKSFRIDYKRNGHWRPYYTDGFHTTILGHQNHGGWYLDTRPFKHPIILDALSVTPVTWYSNVGLICMKIRLHGCAYVCQRNLLSEFPDKLKDDFLTASSAKYPRNEPKQIAMEGHAWCAKINDKKQWIQFNFDKVNVISKITTAGNKKKSYVKTYIIQFSTDNNTWTDYKQKNITRIFQGNDDSHHGMTHDLINQIEAAYVRIIPITWEKNICMRVSLYGCEAECDQPLLAGPSGNSNFQYASSDKYSHPEFALFDTGKAWCTDKTPLHSQYLEIDLGKPYRITKIATKPSQLSYQKGSRVSTFTLKYRTDISWIDYAVEGKAKVLRAVNKTSGSDPVFHALTDYYRDKNGLLTKGFRIYPREFTGQTICLTVELYGCLAGSETVPTTQRSIIDYPVHVSIRFTSIKWNENMKDKNSEEFRITREEIVLAVQSVYKEDIKLLHNVIILKLSKGSVVAKILLLFNAEFADGGNATLPLEIAVKSGKVGNLEVDKNSFRILKDGNVESISSEDQSDGLSGGAIAGIVIGILLIIALIVGAFAYFFLKRRKSSERFNLPVSYSKAQLDEDEL